jgi:serine/threonine-protein kinase
LNIAVELADARDGARLWGEQWRRPASDIFTVQEEIARAVAPQLNVKLSGAEQRRLAKRYTENTTAYRLYLQGRYHYFQFNRASLVRK